MKAVEMAVAKVVAVMVEEEMAAVMGEAVMVAVVMVGGLVVAAKVAGGKVAVKEVVGMAAVEPEAATVEVTVVVGKVVGMVASPSLRQHNIEHHAALYHQRIRKRPRYCPARQLAGYRKWHASILPMSIPIRRPSRSLSWCQLVSRCDCTNERHQLSNWPPLAAR